MREKVYKIEIDLWRWYAVDRDVGKNKKHQIEREACGSRCGYGQIWDISKPNSCI